MHSAASSRHEAVVRLLVESDTALEANDKDQAQSCYCYWWLHVPVRDVTPSSSYS